MLLRVVLTTLDGWVVFAFKRLLMLSCATVNGMRFYSLSPMTLSSTTVVKSISLWRSLANCCNSDLLG